MAFSSGRTWFQAFYMFHIMKNHDLFKPKTFEEGQCAVVGQCNGFTTQQRWEAETPAFAKAILRYAQNGATLLDYGCGVGRIAKTILDLDASGVVSKLVGVDASEQMLKQAERHVANKRFAACRPEELGENVFDVAYLVYVLQHVPAISIRNVLARIHYHLKDDGVLVYCSSDYRMAIRYDKPQFFDDRVLGVDLRAEISQLFEVMHPLFTEKELSSNLLLKRMTTGADGGLAHPALVYKRKKITQPYFEIDRTHGVEHQVTTQPHG